LRFLAAFGVLWIHTWTIFGNPRFFVGPVDIANIMALGGNGVDLFFVISGFCMYYFYASRTNFSYHDFYRFLVKRWVRLSPAFYTATLAYLLMYKFVDHKQVDFVGNLFHSLFYLYYILGRYITAGHFWTLTVEWQFYFTIPWLLIYQTKKGFNRVFILMFGLLFLSCVVGVLIYKKQADLFTGTLLFHGLEFGCGILCARLMITNQTALKHRSLWMTAFILITYVGRVLISKPAFDYLPNYYNLLRLSGFSLMGLGFSGILYLSITSKGKLGMILGNNLFISLGKISYSFYLFHGMVFPFVVNAYLKYAGRAGDMIDPVCCTILSVAAIYPVARLSYRFLEKPFFSVGNLTTK